MKYKQTITILVIFIAILSLFASALGIFSNGGIGQHYITSFYGNKVLIYGNGIYRNDSVSVASQGIAQDIITIILGIPLLTTALYLSRKGLLKGQLLLSGTLAYFLYTYTSYSFLWMYNSLFLIYVVLMSTSFFAFLFTMMSFNIEKLPLHFNKKLPVKFLGLTFIFIGISIGLMWIGRIIPPLLSHSIPPSLEHYTTLPIQALDLGFIVPLAFLTGILIIKKKPFGYLLSSVITTKGITMLTSITAMIIGQISLGIKVSFIEIIIFPVFNLIIIYCLFLVMKNIQEVPK